MPASKALLSPTSSRPIPLFLAPSWTNASLLLRLQRRYISSAPPRRAQHTKGSSSNSDSETDSAQASTPPPPSSTPKKPSAPLTKEQEAYLDSALRVNQAGELAATLIYAAQTPPLSRSHPHLRPLLEHMHAQEAGHLKTFNALLAKHRIRPTALTPVWSIAASGLGWATGLMGREAAMACTEAVETEIGGHYNGQVRELLRWKREREAEDTERGEGEGEGEGGLGEELEGLLGEVRRIRDEELEHLDTAVGEDAKEARGYPVLTAVVRGGCRGAIWLSERV